MHALEALSVTFSMTMTIRGQSACRSKRVVARACSLTSAWAKQLYQQSLFATYISIHFSSHLPSSQSLYLIRTTQLQPAQRPQRVTTTTTKSFSSKVTSDAVAYTT